MAVTSLPHALPPEHIWDPKQRVHTEMALWRLSDHGAVFQLFFQNISAIFVNMQSDLT